MKKVLWVKFGWSEYYRGGPVDGNFEWLQRDDGEGHEAYNFMPGPDGRYYCYVPPHGKANAYPSSEDPHGWTVICLAKFPPQKGVNIVGWLENATLTGKPTPRPEYDDKIGFRLDVQGVEFTYSIEADTAFFVRPEDRVPFSHTSIKQAKFSYLSGPDASITQTPEKTEILRIVERELKRLRPLAVGQPNVVSAPDETENNIDPLGGFGSPEHRKAVEMKAEEATTAELNRMGYDVVRRADEKIGYDLQAIPRSGGQDLLVEVKGTSEDARRFFMTPKEYDFRGEKGWRLAMVTNALDKPDVLILRRSEVEKRFSIKPMVWIGLEVNGSE